MRELKVDLKRRNRSIVRTDLKDYYKWVFICSRCGGKFGTDFKGCPKVCPNCKLLTSRNQLGKRLTPKNFY
jgi:hypothetical protein